MYVVTLPNGRVEDVSRFNAFVRDGILTDKVMDFAQDAHGLELSWQEVEGAPAVWVEVES